jgi:hypothetical protein
MTGGVQECMQHGTAAASRPPQPYYREIIFYCYHRFRGCMQLMHCGCVCGATTVRGWLHEAPINSHIGLLGLTLVMKTVLLGLVWVSFGSRPLMSRPH